jgi:hypothetical protein
VPNESTKPDWYVIDEVPKYWDGEKWRRFKWPEPPGVYVIQDVEYYWNGSNMRLRVRRSYSNSLNNSESVDSLQSSNSQETESVKKLGRQSKPKVFKIVLVLLYAFSVLGSVQNYSATYSGQPVFSLIGIIDNFVITLIPSAIVYAIGAFYFRFFKR